MSSVDPPTPDADGKITVENVNTPGKTSRVRADRYLAMREAMLKALPEASPGLTQAEMMEAVKQYLPDDLFPGGEKAGWWSKCVQLDLEAKGLLTRETTKPLRWRINEVDPG